jgi:hypothetical protein
MIKFNVYVLDRYGKQVAYIADVTTERLAIVMKELSRDYRNDRVIAEVQR